MKNLIAISVFAASTLAAQTAGLKGNYYFEETGTTQTGQAFQVASILSFDEPTSMLDPQGADDVLAAVTRLNADLGTTVVLAEHRLERVVQHADRVVELGAI